MTRTTLLALALATTLPGLAAATTPGAHFLQNWDQNGDGLVTLDEARTKRNDIFTSFDADEDGLLSATEFAALDQMRAEDQAQMREEMAKDMGSHMGGHMGGHMAGQMGQGHGKGHGKGMGQGQGQGQGQGMGMPGEAGMMRAFNDTNSDGAVSRQEFTAQTASWLARMDRNGDGQVSAADFGG